MNKQDFGYNILRIITKAAQKNSNGIHNLTKNWNPKHAKQLQAIQDILNYQVYIRPYQNRIERFADEIAINGYNKPHQEICNVIKYYGQPHISVTGKLPQDDGSNSQYNLQDGIVTGDLIKIDKNSYVHDQIRKYGLEHTHKSKDLLKYYNDYVFTDMLPALVPYYINVPSMRPDIGTPIKGKVKHYIFRPNQMTMNLCFWKNNRNKNKKLWHSIDIFIKSNYKLCNFIVGSQLNKKKATIKSKRDKTNIQKEAHLLIGNNLLKIAHDPSYMNIWESLGKDVYIPYAMEHPIMNSNDVINQYYICKDKNGLGILAFKED